MGAKVTRCGRCGKRCRHPERAWDWNAEVADDRHIADVCPDCQTAHENAEAEVNAALLDYSNCRVAADGRVTGIRRKATP